MTNSIKFNSIKFNSIKSSSIKYCVLAMASVASSAAAGAQTALQFDLVCTGESKTGAWTGRYRVDLEAGKYCGGACKAPESIDRIEPDKLTLKDRGPFTSNPKDRNDMWRVTINRADGAYESHFVMISAGVVDTVKGACTVAEFTPLPKTLF